jgi:hypothetical protein
VLDEQFDRGADFVTAGCRPTRHPHPVRAAAAGGERGVEHCGGAAVRGELERGDRAHLALVGRVDLGNLGRDLGDRYSDRDDDGAAMFVRWRPNR